MIRVVLILALAVVLTFSIWSSRTKRMERESDCVADPAYTGTTGGWQGVIYTDHRGGEEIKFFLDCDGMLVKVRLFDRDNRRLNWWVITETVDAKLHQLIRLGVVRVIKPGSPAAQSWREAFSRLKEDFEKDQGR